MSSQLSLSEINGEDVFKSISRDAVLIYLHLLKSVGSVGLTEQQLNDMAESMDLSIEDLSSLFNDVVNLEIIDFSDAYESAVVIRLAAELHAAGATDEQLDYFKNKRGFNSHDPFFGILEEADEDFERIKAFLRGMDHTEVEAHIDSLYEGGGEK